ncbi:MAG: site-specific DNA-methyltransferase [Pseudobutyrivibrio ruminis]|nr:site-specific DNA-methyltransferase [Pseudobutyrivibrio ruminis]
MENKVTKEIFNPINENIKKLESLFPEIVKDGQVDFEALKQELGQFEEVGKEKYELTWPGKTQAKQLANTDIVGKTLKYVPEDSKNPETTENLYIEGDNLEVLKLLRNSYYGKIKMIYIDPPYNTGNDFVYRDKFESDKDIINMLEGEINEIGERLVKNQKSSSYYHSNWLSMLYPRIKLARELLTDEGVIFISINDDEVVNLRKICDEIFGANNFIHVLKWKRKKQPSFLHGHVASVMEYIVIYAKDSNKLEKLSIETRSDGNTRVDNKSNSVSMRLIKKGIRVKLPKEVTIIKAGIYKNKTMETEYLNDVYIKDGRTINDFYAKARFRNEQQMIDKFVENDVLFITKNYGFRRDLLSEELEKRKSITDLLLDWGDNQDSDSEINELFPEGKPFDYPKPVKLIKNLIACVDTEEQYIMDFFSGSATTSQAVFELNAEDGLNRKFILVQLPEPCDEKSEAYKAGYKNICEIGKERIRRAGEKIKEEFKDKEGIEKLDVGFKVFRVADTNIRWNSEALKEGQITMEEATLKNKDLIDFNPGFTDIDVVYEIMLRHRDFPLTSKIEKLSNIGERTYIFADAIVVCLEEKVTDKIVDGIAAIEPKPIKVIFRDSAFDDDISLKLNTMNRLDAQLKKHNQGKEQSYRVEFI